MTGITRPSVPRPGQKQRQNHGPERSSVRPWDYQSASWQTIQGLRRGKQCLTNTVYSGGRELLTLTGNIIGQWKEYYSGLSQILEREVINNIKILNAFNLLNK
ncbi:hypothetical protein ILYODFUR_019676 [Ilyodon furcidens]|uniref:Uncharacterized protein n=1 Tax=Ilyodon furcidens TaxID=33524 RepID=A0ABV0UIG4_9TELE